MPDKSIKYIWAEAGETIFDVNDKPIFLTGISQDITERKLTELQLKEKNAEIETQNEELQIAKETAEENENYQKTLNQKLELLFDILPIGITVLDNEGEIIKQNEQISKVLEISHENLLTGDYKKRKYIKTDSSEMKFDEFPSSRIQNGEKFVNNIEIGIIKENNELIWTEVSAVECTFPHWRVVIVTNNITERKKIDYEIRTAKDRAEESEVNLLYKTEEYEAVNEELRQANEELYNAKEKAEANELRLKIAQTASNAGTWDWDIVSNTFYWSEEFLKIFGMPPVTIPGFEAWSKVLHPEDVEKASKKIQESIENNIELINDYRIILPNNEIRWIRSYGNTYYENNIPKRMIGLCLDITKQKETKQELILAKEKAEENAFKLNLMLENAPETIFIQTEQKFVYVNNQALKLFGAENKEQLLGTMVIERIHPDFREIAKKRISNLNIHKQNQPSIEQKYIKIDGTVIDVDVSVVPINFENENGTLVFVRDITERKKSEKELIEAKEKVEKSEYNLLIKNEEYESINEELRQTNDELIYAKEKAEESEHRFKALHNASFGGIAIHDKGIILECNQGLSEITGYSFDELIGMDGLLLIAPNSREMVMSNILAGYEKPYEGFGLRKNGEIFPLRLEARNIYYKGKKARTIEFRDITESKKAEEALRKSEAIKNKLVSNIGDVIVIIDQNGINQYKSPNITKFFGWKPEELVGKNMWDNIHPDDFEAGQKFINNLLSQPNNTGTTELRYKRIDGNYVWIEINFVNLLHDKDIQGLLGNYHDISDRKQAENELINAKEKAEESDRLKTQFLLNMSHEIRTPMNAINGFSNMLNKPDLTAEKRKSYTSVIINSSNQLQSIVENILTISALETKQEKTCIKPVYINGIIVDLLAIFKTQATNQNISIYAKQQLTDKQSEIYSDITKITQILTNLITNALKFTHVGTIEFGYELTPDLSASERPANVLQFYVKDTGIGIKPEMQEQIFKRFVQAETGLTRRYGGNGLGLSISKGLVELLGGKIWVQSEFGKGSTFYFTIPYNPVNEIDKTILPTKQNESFVTVLVAEDEEFNFLFIEEVLIDMDLKLIHAKNGHEAVDICKTNFDISLILMDIKMPIMDGHIAAKQIKEFRPNLTIIAQSAYTLDQYLEKYNENPFDGYITKPIKEADLKQKMRNYIENNLIKQNES